MSETNKRNISLFTLLLKITLVTTLAFLTACQKQARPSPEDSGLSTGHLIHRVQFSGETLALISDWYTGSSKNWKEIEKYNKGLNIYKIKIGDKILIPESLVKERKPLPRNFVKRTSQRLETSKPASTSEPLEPTTKEDSLDETLTPEPEVTKEDLPSEPEINNIDTKEESAIVVPETQKDLNPPTVTGATTKLEVFEEENEMPKSATTTQPINVESALQEEKHIAEQAQENAAASVAKAEEDSKKLASPEKNAATTEDAKVKSRYELLQELLEEE